MTSTAVEDVNKALGRPVWQQLYAPSKWEACEKILHRAQAAGCSVIALTVDNTTGRNSETFLRMRPRTPLSAPPAMKVPMVHTRTSAPCTTVST